MRFVKKSIAVTAILAGSLFSLVLHVALAGWIAIQTPPVARFVTAQALASVNGKIAGSLSAGRARIDSHFRIHLHDLVLRAPDGDVAARVASLDVAVMPASPLRVAADLHDAELDLTPDAKNRTAIQRALEPRDASTHQTPTRTIVALTAEDTRILRRPTVKEPRPLVMDLATLRIDVDSSMEATTLSLDARGNAIAPVTGEILVSGRVESDTAQTTLRELRVALGASHAEAGRIHFQRASGRIEGALRAHVDPAIRPLLPPGATLATAVDLEAGIEPAPSGSTARVDLSGVDGALLHAEATGTTSRFDATVDAKKIDLAAWGVSREPEKIETGHARIERDGDAGTITLRATLRSGRIASGKSVDARADLATDGRAFRAKVDVVRERRTILRTVSAGAVDLAALRAKKVDLHSIRTFDVVLSAPDLGALAPGRQGSVTARLHVRDGRVKGTGTFKHGVHDLTAIVAAEGDDERLQATARITRAGRRGTSTITAVVAKPFATNPRWRLEGTLENFLLENGDAAVEQRMLGRIAGTFSLAGKGRTGVTGDARLSASGVEVKGRAVLDATFIARLARTGIEASLAAVDPDRNELHAEFRVEGDPDGWIANGASFNAARLSGSIDSPPLQLWRLSGISPEIPELGGTIETHATIAGRVDAPRLDGRAAVRGGVVNTVAAGRLGGIDADLLFTHERIALTRLVGAGRSGNFKGTGEIARRTDGWQYAAEFRARDLGLHGESVFGRFDGTVHATGNATTRELVAEVVLERGAVELPDMSKNVQPGSPHPDIVYHPAGSDRRLVAGHDPKPGHSTIRIKTVRPVQVRGANLSVDLHADLEIDARDGRTNATGTITPVRGYLWQGGKKYEVDRESKVVFAGGAIEDGRLHFHTTHVVPDADHTKIFFVIDGTLERPMLSLASDPPLPENSVAAMVMLGTNDPRVRPAETGDPSAAAGAGRNLQNVFTAKLRGSFQQSFAPDVFRIAPGAANSAQGRVAVGNYIAPALYLEYAYAFAAAHDRGPNELQLTYRFARAWHLDGATDDVGRDQAIFSGIYEY